MKLILNYIIIASDENEIVSRIQFSNYINNGVLLFILCIYNP